MGSVIMSKAEAVNVVDGSEACFFFLSFFFGISVELSPKMEGGLVHDRGCNALGKISTSHHG